MQELQDFFDGGYINPLVLFIHSDLNYIVAQYAHYFMWTCPPQIEFGK
jgi:hypothetical protein